MLQIRLAESHEIEWINQCYDEVGFAHSDFDNELIAIAEVNGKKAALGRLIIIDSQNMELGGMYVFEEFRGLGIAKHIIEFLLQFSDSLQTIYCIPFKYLVPLYSQYGFVPCLQLDRVPKKVMDKFSWCQNKYEVPTSLLVLAKE